MKLIEEFLKYYKELKVSLVNHITFRYPTFMHKNLIKQKISQTKKNSDQNQTEIKLVTPDTSVSDDVDSESPKVGLSKKIFKC